MAYAVVTGSHGFIGTHILEALLGHLGTSLTPQDSSPLTLVASDLTTTTQRPTAQRFLGNPRVDWVPFPGLVETLEARISSGDGPPLCVVHNGACSSTVERDPQVFASLNTKPSQDLWNFCCRHRVPFIYASSASVYGDGSLGFSDAKEMCGQYTPLNLYARSKWEFDMWVLEQKEHPPWWFGLRYFNVYGPWEDHKGGQASMVYHGFRQAMEQGVIRLFESNTPTYGHGEQVRDFVSVADVVAFTGMVLKKGFGDPHWAQGLPGGGLFLNVAPGQARSWNSLAEAIFQALGKPARISYIPMPKSLENQYQNFTQATHTTAHAHGLHHTWQSLEAGVDHCIKSHLLPRWHACS